MAALFVGTGDLDSALRLLVSPEFPEFMMLKKSLTAEIRLLRPTDLSAAVALSTVAGWNQREDDWRMLLELAPEGCFGIEADGMLVATTTLLSYGQRLAWIGMVLTKPEYRGSGLARTLVTHSVELADSAGTKTVKLDATDQGQHLYESLGFVAEGVIERWSRPGTANLCATLEGPCPDQLWASDLAAFGADRSAMLSRLARRGEVYTATNGYLLVRAGRNTAYLGPCITDNPASAQVLLETALSAHSSVAWSWDLLPENQNAVALATKLGFTRQRVLTRMARGEPLRGRSQMIYAIAGFELG